MQYSPLLEFHDGRGVVIFCQLDVTGRTQNDPAGDRIARNLLEYVDGYKSAAVRSAVYVGDAAGKTYLEATGIPVKSYEGGAMDGNDVLVIGPGSAQQLATSAPAVAEFLKAGGHAIAIGLDQSDLKSLPFKITTKSSEFITTTFEPFSMASPLRGVGPADLDNRDPRDIPLITAGATVYGNGVLAVAPDNANVAFCQLAPWQFDYQKQYNLKRTYRRASYAVVRLLANAGVSSPTPVLARFASPVAPGAPERRYLDGLYIDKPEEWDDPYRFFCW
jgi:hypothetical protein